MPVNISVSKHCFLIITAFMFHLFKWEQPLYKALSHQRNKWQSQAILCGWKVCVWFHPSPHQLPPAQRRRWVLKDKRGTLTQELGGKRQTASLVSSCQISWPSIVTKYAHRKRCPIFDYVTCFPLANSRWEGWHFTTCPPMFKSFLREGVISGIGLWDLFSGIKADFALSYIFSWWLNLDNCSNKALTTAFLLCNQLRPGHATSLPGLCLEAESPGDSRAEIWWAVHSTMSCICTRTQVPKSLEQIWMGFRWT